VHCKRVFLRSTQLTRSYTADSPAYCNSGSVYVGWTSIFGCDPMGYVNWPLTNTFLGCDGSGVLLGSLQDTIWYLNIQVSLLRCLFV
jgi:hypothetical protein